MDVRSVVRVHEARRAFQVAPVGQVDDQGQPSPGLDTPSAVVVDRLVVRAREIVTNVKRFHAPEERGIGRENGHEAMASYTETKAVWTELSGVSRDPFQIG